MKVFVSWSGSASQRVATALHAWLTDMFHEVDPWMSDQDITAGSRWHSALNSELEVSKFGILCLTDENLKSPWLLFEAGCLARDLAAARVVPYLFGLTAANVGPPLSQFQGVTADEAGTEKLAYGVNAVLPRPLPKEKVKRAFDRWWPDLRIALDCIKEERGNILDALRTERAMLEELIDLTREIRGATTKSYSIQYEETVNRIFRVIERIRQMDRMTFEKTIKDAEAAASQDSPGASAAQLFLEVATRWLKLGMPIGTTAINAPTVEAVRPLKRRPMK